MLLGELSILAFHPIIVETNLSDMCLGIDAEPEGYEKGSDA